MEGIYLTKLEVRGRNSSLNGDRTVDRISFLPFFLQSFPESIIILYLGLNWTGTGSGLRKLIPLAFLGAGISYLIRIMPLVFGIHTLIQFAVLILLVHVWLKANWRTSLVAILLGSFAMGFAESLIDPLILFIADLTISDLLSDPWLRVLVPLPHIILLGLLAALTKYRNWIIVNLNPSIERESNVSSLFVIILFQAFLIIMLNVAFYAYRSGIFPTLELELLFGIVNIILIAASFTTIIMANKMLNITHQEALLKERSRQMEVMQELYLAVRSQRHDFLNHVTSLYGLLMTNDFPAAQKYMETLYEDVKQNHTLMNIGIPALSGLLHTKASIAWQKGIDFKIDIDQEFSDIPLSSVDLTGIMGNLIDNAIEATPLKGVIQNKIRVELLFNKREESYIIRVLNTTPRPSEEIIDKLLRPGFSTKDRAKHSGLGLSTIASITQKYCGHIDVEYDAEESFFIVQIRTPSQPKR